MLQETKHNDSSECSVLESLDSQSEYEVSMMMVIIKYSRFILYRIERIMS